MTTSATPDSRPDARESRRRRRLTTTDLALVAAFAALIAACAYLGGIPVGGAGVPITLQTFGVLLAGCVLGPVRGFLAAALYLVLGAVGLPVFAEHTSGLGVFTGISRRLPLVASRCVGPARRPPGRAGRPRATGRTRAIVVFLCPLPARAAQPRARRRRHEAARRRLLGRPPGPGTRRSGPVTCSRPRWSRWSPPRCTAPSRSCCAGADRRA